MTNIPNVLRFQVKI